MPHSYKLVWLLLFPLNPQVSSSPPRPLPPLPPPSPSSSGSPTLIWSDEFNGGVIDVNSWTALMGDGTSFGMRQGGGSEGAGGGGQGSERVWRGGRGQTGRGKQWGCEAGSGAVGQPGRRQGRELGRAALTGGQGKGSMKGGVNAPIPHLRLKESGPPLQAFLLAGVITSSSATPSLQRTSMDRATSSSLRRTTAPRPAPA